MTDDFNVIYPPLVEQAFDLVCKVNGFEDISKAEVYKELVAEGLLNENGKPTEKAILSGFVKQGLSLPTQELTDLAIKVLPREYRFNQDGRTLISSDAGEYLEKLVKSNSPDSEDAEPLLKWFVANLLIDTKDIDYLKDIASGKLKVIKNREKLSALLPLLDYSLIEGRTPNAQGGNIVIHYKEALRVYEVAYKTAPNVEFKALAKKILDVLRTI